MGPTTKTLLDEIGVPTGATCVDLGCGGGHVGRYLAELVGPTGRVLGLDFDDVKLAAARDECDPAIHGNVEFRVANVTQWTESQACDLVYGRFILSHLSDRASMVSRCAAALRRQGVLVLEDIDFAGAFCYPTNEAFRRYCEWYCALVLRRGGDAVLGPQLMELCLDAGLEEVQLRMVQPVHTGQAAGKELTLSTLVNIAEAVVAEGLSTMGQVEETVLQLRNFTADPRSIIGLPRIFQVWGRRP
jgi:2-polyprenyl-3-methyl-5-hydroxy-6-metoxy-1,4-benzoquinol methylase